MRTSQLAGILDVSKSYIVVLTLSGVLEPLRKPNSASGGALAPTTPLENRCSGQTLELSSSRIDQSPFLTVNPHWARQELEDSGAFVTAQQSFDTVAALRGEEAEQEIRQMIDGMLTKHAKSEIREWIVQCNLKMPRDLAATLAYNHNHTDWRDLVPRIKLPTLIISGRASNIPWKSQDWIHRQIQGSQFEVFEEAEGGKHFMFIENPEKFNRLVMEYLR